MHNSPRSDYERGVTEARVSKIDDRNDNSNTSPLNWRSYFQKNAKGVVLQNLRNTTLAIENDPRFKGLHWFNEMTRSEVLLNGTGQYYLVDDIYFITAQLYIQNETPLQTIGIDNIRSAILSDCHQHKFHPVRKELCKTEWDEKERITSWTVKYLGAEDNPYNCAIGAMFLVSMIARIMLPGCQCDHMMVLEGDQGIGKSTVCKILFGEYFSDYLPDISTRDACDHVSKFWGIEIAEMHVFNRAETSHLKSFISRTEEVYRPAYGRMEVTRPRQCVFIGTTNQELYLKDETGGRRFWPVKCGHIDLDGLKRDRDQLLAEAHVRFGESWHWWPAREFESKFIKPEQARRHEFDEWQNIFVKNINAVIDRKNTTIAEIYQNALAVGINRLPNNAEAQRISKFLKTMGATSRRTKNGMIWDVSKVV